MSAPSLLLKLIHGKEVVPHRLDGCPNVLRTIGDSQKCRILRQFDARIHGMVIGILGRRKDMICDARRSSNLIDLRRVKDFMAKWEWLFGRYYLGWDVDRILGEV